MNESDGVTGWDTHLLKVQGWETFPLTSLVLAFAIINTSPHVAAKVKQPITFRFYKYEHSGSSALLTRPFAWFKLSNLYNENTFYLLLFTPRLTS